MDHRLLFFPKPELDRLIQGLRQRGYLVVGPTVQDGAIVYDELEGASDLPVGVGDRHGPGFYRLEKRQDGSYFGFVVGPHSYKKYLHPPRLSLFKAHQDGNGFRSEPPGEPPAYAFFGLRACELAAIAVQDRVFGHSFQDPHYQARRRKAFRVAVNCSEAGETCFCLSMGTGPNVKPGTADIALTELEAGFLAQAGSQAGADLLQELAAREATPAEHAQGQQRVQQAAAQMGRSLPREGLRDLLLHNLEHPRWEEVAQRCLGCANCTMVCPTCFCFTVEDHTDLTGQSAERVRTWDSCFSVDFTYTGGHAVRQSTRSRYRQWMTHKLASWHDQFGESGCVGCGRCITWCPVGIDITEEVAAIRATPSVQLQET